MPTTTDYLSTRADDYTAGFSQSQIPEWLKAAKTNNPVYNPTTNTLTRSATFTGTPSPIHPTMKDVGPEEAYKSSLPYSGLSEENKTGYGALRGQLSPLSQQITTQQNLRPEERNVQPGQSLTDLLPQLQNLQSQLNQAYPTMAGFSPTYGGFGQPTSAPGITQQVAEGQNLAGVPYQTQAPYQPQPQQPQGMNLWNPNVATTGPNPAQQQNLVLLSLLGRAFGQQNPYGMMSPPQQGAQNPQNLSTLLQLLLGMNQTPQQMAGGGWDGALRNPLQGSMYPQQGYFAEQPRGLTGIGTPKVPGGPTNDLDEMRRKAIANQYGGMEERRI